MTRRHIANHKPRKAVTTEPEHEQNSAAASDNQNMAASIRDKNDNNDNRRRYNNENSSSSSDEARERSRRKRAELRRKRRGDVPEPSKMTVYTPKQRADTFRGKLIVQDRAAAVEFATEAHQRSSMEDLVFWSDGSLRTDKVEQGQRKAGGAAVVYTCQPGNEKAWEDHGYGVVDLESIKLLELFGIGAALRLATLIMTGSITPRGSPSPTSSPSPQSCLDRSSPKLTSVTRKVTILTDSQQSIELLGGKTSAKNKTEIEILRMIIAWSHKLISLQGGIEIEIHWVPAHMARTPWNERADLMARAASSSVRRGLGTTNQDGTIVVVDSSFLQCP